MLDKKHKLFDVKTSKILDSLFIWNHKSKFEGSWIEFSSYKQYNLWDDAKNIDFVKSNLYWKILTKSFEEKKELSVYFIFDLNESFVWNKKNILLQILYLVWFSVIENGDKFWSLIDKKLFFAKKWKQNFFNILKYLENITQTSLLIRRDETQNNLEYFNKLKINNSLVFYCTDKLDFDIKELKIISRKNDFVLCNIFNCFENNLDWTWVPILSDLENSLFINLNDSISKKEYKDLRNSKIKKLRSTVLKNKWKYLFFDESVDIYNMFYKFFKK
jgi:hypothetical protein